MFPLSAAQVIPSGSTVPMGNSFSLTKLVHYSLYHLICAFGSLVSIFSNWDFISLFLQVLPMPITNRFKGCPCHFKLVFIYIETKNPVFSMLSSVKCRNSQEINDFSTLSDTLFYPLSQNQKYLQSGFHPNPEGYRKSTVRLDNC